MMEFSGSLVCNLVCLFAEGYIRLYRFKDSGRQLELVHRTATGGIPGALTGLKGKLLAGIGSTLRVYEAGRKKLLRKCEHRKLPTHIMTLATSGDRIYVGDQQVPTQETSVLQHPVVCIDVCLLMRCAPSDSHCPEP